MRRYKVALQYMGTNYSGWQRSPTGAKPAVQDVVERAIDTFVGKGNWVNPIQCSSRTDAGVHALRNVMHVDLMRRSRQVGEQMEHHLPETVHQALNYFLRESQVHILGVEAVPGGGGKNGAHNEEENAFHARFSARERRYIYRLLTGHSVFESERAWCLESNQHLDIDAMRRASQVLVGQRQDFTSFRGKDCQAKSPVKMIRRIHIVEATPELTNCGAYGQLIHVHVHAESFLYHMVRNIVGALYAIGYGRLPVSAMEEILAAKNRSVAPAMAPACGLYLANVLYADDLEKEKEEKERKNEQQQP